MHRRQVVPIGAAPGEEVFAVSEAYVLAGVCVYLLVVYGHGCHAEIQRAVGAVTGCEVSCGVLSTREAVAVPHQRPHIVAHDGVVALLHVVPHMQAVADSAVAAGGVGDGEEGVGDGVEHADAGSIPRQVVLHDGVVYLAPGVFPDGDDHRQQAVGPMAVGEGDGLHPAVGEGYAVPHYRQLVAANRRVGLRRGVAPYMEGVVQRAIAAYGVGQDVGGVGVGAEGVYSRQAPREAVLHYGVVARGAAVFSDSERHDGDAVGAVDVCQRQCLHSGVVEGQAVPHHRQLVAAEGAVYGVERVEPHVKVVVYSAVAACVVGHQVVDGGVGHERLMPGEAPR